jgi:threonine 3-dehydrogenase
MALNSTMKALVKPYGKLGLELSSVPIPEFGPQDVLIRVLVTSICGSDVHIYDNAPVFRDRVAHNQITGHEFCGKVEAIGSEVTTAAVGDIVSVESHIVCGTCYYCLNGLSHLCQEVSTIGIDRPGAFAEYIAIPAKNAILKPPDLPLDVAAILEPFGNAVDTARCVDLVGKSVLITGCGPQGLMAIAIAKAAGARQVIATEIWEGRRELARKMLKVHSNSRERNSDLVLDANDPGMSAQIFEATDGLGVDVVLEMSGHPTAIHEGLLTLKSSGHVVALGLSSASTVEIDWNRGLILKGATFHGIYGRHLFQTWYEMSRLLESGKVKLEPIIYPERFALEQYNEAFQLLKQGKAAKVIMYPNSPSEIN